MKKAHMVLLLGNIMFCSSFLLIESQAVSLPNEEKVFIIDKEVQFIDKEGKLTSKISLHSETNTVIKKNRIGKKETTSKYKQVVYKHAKISKNSKYLVIIENTGDKAFIDEEKKEHLLNDGETTGKITLYDMQGKLLFEKQLPKGRETVDEEFLAENGDIFAVNTFDTTSKTDEPKAMIFVYDKNGQEVLTIPTKADGGKFAISKIDKISDNGKYLIVRLSSGTRFYNLKNLAFWDSKKRYLIWNITNEGIVKVRDAETKETLTIDLKKFIGD